jgi:peptidyl-prolyl cis-trans isomerase SurA
MDMLIDERLQLQEARKAGVTTDEADVAKILEGMAQKNNLSVDGLAEALGHAGVNIKTLKDRIRSQIAWQETVQRKFRRDVQISDSDIDKAVSGAGGETAATENTLQLRQVRFDIPAGADQRTIAARLAAAEDLRARFGSCAELTKSIDGASVKTLQDQKPASLAQPARLLVMNAKVGQMTPPTITQAAVELYAVCGKQSAKGDEDARQEAQRKLMGAELSIRAERLLRDIRQEAFIEYR